MPTNQSLTFQHFSNWSDDLDSRDVRLEPRKTHEDPFHAVISHAECNALHLSRLTVTRHEVLHSRSHIATSKGTADLCCITLQLRGVGRHTQRDHAQTCGPGDLAVTAATEPFTVEVFHNFQTLCFTVSRALLPRGFLDRPRLRLSTTETGRALSRTLMGYADLCLASRSPAETAASFSMPIVELICHAGSAVREEAPERMAAPVVLSMMLDHISRHSGDPDLSALTLARQFRCSVRYVHKLFASTGRSVGEHVNDTRMSACVRDLLDDRSQRTIAELAFAAGFNDMSHFNRLFKRANGMSPRDFRRAMAARPKGVT